MAAERVVPLAVISPVRDEARYVRHTLDAMGCRVEAWREFPDHHAYTRADVEELGDWARNSQADLVLCTRKDFVKMRASELGETPLRAVGVELRFLAGEEALHQALDRLPSPKLG